MLGLIGKEALSVSERFIREFSPWTVQHVILLFIKTNWRKEKRKKIY